MVLTEKQQDLVDKVMDNFDFEKVHKCMVGLDWKWFIADSKSSYDRLRVPMLSEIKIEARKLLKRVAVRNETNYIFMGGLEAQYQDDVLSLKFIVSHWDEE